MRLCLSTAHCAPMTRPGPGSAHALYIDLIRCAGLFVAGLFAIFQLYSMCLKTGFFGVRQARLLTFADN